MTVSASQTRAPLGRPVGASGEETRRRITIAAMRCVAEVGYSKATIREIARAADMTSGSLYHYFPNKAELLKATGQEIEDIVLPRLRAAAAKSGDVVDRLGAVLDESKLLMHDYPYLAAFLRALRAEGTAQSRRGGPNYPGSRALREVVTDIIGPEPRHVAAVEAICALTRGLSEQAAKLSPDAYQASLESVKKLIGGTLFARVHPHG